MPSLLALPREHAMINQLACNWFGIIWSTNPYEAMREARLVRGSLFGVGAEKLAGRSSISAGTTYGDRRFRTMTGQFVTQEPFPS